MNIVDTTTGDELAELIPLLETAYHSPPLTSHLSKSAVAARQNRVKAVEAAFCQWSGSSCAFTAFNFLLTGLVTTALLGKTINYISGLADSYDRGMSSLTKMSKSGWPVIGSAFGITALAFIWNQINKKHIDNKYPVSRDQLFSFFSQALVYMAYDVLVTFFGPFPPSTLIATFAIGVPMPIVSAVFTTSSETKKLMLPSEWDEKNFPTYYKASKSKKCMNTIKGIATANTALTTTFWAFKRQLEGQSVKAKSYETISMVAIAILYGGYFGSQLTRSPRAYNTFFMICTYITFFSLCYSSLSGIGFHSLFERHGHTHWDESTKQTLTILFSIISTILSTFGALTTLFPFEKNEKGTPLSNYISNKVTKSYAFTQISQTTSTLFSNCCAKDTQKNDEQKNENNEHIEMQDMAICSPV